MERAKTTNNLKETSSLMHTSLVKMTRSGRSYTHPPIQALGYSSPGIPISHLTTVISLIKNDILVDLDENSGISKTDFFSEHQIQSPAKKFDGFKFSRVFGKET
jgi:hypothetical protein